MSRLRRGEATVGQMPPEVAGVLEACRAARVLSDGWFDPWALPGGVDPTGYVKGWAAERALDALRMPDVAAAVVNAAGDIASFGGPAPGAPFRFAVVDPFDRARLACVVEHTGAVATSGTYERGQHLFDPHSRRAASAVASATVTGPELGLGGCAGHGARCRRPGGSRTHRRPRRLRGSGDRARRRSSVDLRVPVGPGVRTLCHRSCLTVAAGEGLRLRRPTAAAARTPPAHGVSELRYD